MAVLQFDPVKVADKIWQSIKGLGTDDVTLIATITSHTNEQLLTVRDKYKSDLKRDIVADIKGDTSGAYQKSLIGLVMRPAEFDAYTVYKAVKGAGTNEKALVDTLVHRTKSELDAIKDAYIKNYASTIEKDIAGDTGGPLQQFFRTILNSERHDPDNVNQEHLIDELSRLHAAGQGKTGTDEKVFVEIITQYGPKYLHILDLEYGRRYGKTLQGAITSEMSGPLQSALLALMCDHNEYYADALFKAVDGVGTNSDRLIRVLVGRRDCLPNINAVFMRKYHKNIHARLDCEANPAMSGNFKKVLLAITANI